MHTYGKREITDFRIQKIDPLIKELARLSGKLPPDVHQDYTTAIIFHADGKYDLAIINLVDLGLRICARICEQKVEITNCIWSNRDKLKWCAQAKEITINSTLDVARKNNLQAIREKEMAIDFERKIIALSSYEATIEKYNELIDCFDPVRINEFDEFTRKISTKSKLNSIVLSLIASTIFFAATTILAAFAKN